MNQADLHGKAAVVTGGARGIGRAIVQALAHAGACVMIGDLRLEEAVAAAEEIGKQTGSCIAATRADVSKLVTQRPNVIEALKRFGKIDVLVNNAGWDRLVPFLKTTPDLWDRIIAINYLGVIHACHVVLPHMVERRQGCIVNVSSDSARVG